MTKRKLIGGSLLAVPFVAIAALVIATWGWVAFALTVIANAVVIGSVTVGVRMFYDD